MYGAATFLLKTRTKILRKKAWKGKCAAVLAVRVSVWWIF